jgi:hypothetical protein
MKTSQLLDRAELEKAERAVRRKAKRISGGSKKPLDLLSMRRFADGRVVCEWGHIRERETK